MWWLLLGAGAVWAIKKVVEEWGWVSDCEPDEIEDLPKKPGIYVMYKRNKIIHVGSSDNLYERLRYYPKKKIMTTFDWFQTPTKSKAKQLEKELQEKVGYKGR